MEQSEVSANLLDVHGTEFSAYGLWNASQTEDQQLLVLAAIAPGKQAAQLNL